MPFAIRALPFSFRPFRRSRRQQPHQHAAPQGLRGKLGRNPLRLLASHALSSRRLKMAVHHQDRPPGVSAEPEVTLDPQEARQGRSGTRTLVVLTISLILAAVAGVALGVIPIGVF
jgi:hypothetical protein